MSPKKQNTRSRNNNGSNNKKQNGGGKTQQTPPITNEQSELNIAKDTYATPQSQEQTQQTSPPEVVSTSSPLHSQSREDETMKNTAKEIGRDDKFYALAPYDEIPGKNISQKKKWCTIKFAKLNGYAGTQIRTLNKSTYLAIILDDQDDFQQIIGSPIEISAGGEDQPPVTITFKDQHVIKPKKTEDDVTLERNATIQVIDIPMNLKTHVVRAVFEKFGEIKSISMKTVKYYQQAFIRFTDVNIAKGFIDLWSIYIGQDSVRILPLILDEQQRQLRKEFCMKLVGLPRGTNARDLRSLIMATQAKACFIPRNPKTYNYMNYAYVYFNSQDQMEEMSLQDFQIWNTELSWVSPDVQTCHLCGEPDHIAKDCNSKTTYNSVDPKLQRLYNKFKPANHRKTKKSYASAAAQNTNRSHDPNKLPGGTSSGGSMHGNDLKSQFLQLQQMFSTYTKKLDSIENQLNQQTASNPSPSTSTSHNSRTNNNGNKKQPTKRVRIETSESEGEGSKNNPVDNNINMQASVAELRQMQVTMQNMMTNLAKAFDKTPQ